MCGRYAASQHLDDLIHEFDIEQGPEVELAADHNVAPTKDVYLVADRVRDTGTVRELHVARWGLVPSWAKDPSIGSRLINARLETVAVKPAFRKALAARRCLLPADGYYEWYTPQPQHDDGRGAPDRPAGTAGPAARGRKQPFFIRPADGGILAMAGLYEFWRDPGRAADDPARWWVTTTVITTTAPDELGRIHDRMPLMVEPARWDQWLAPGPVTQAELAELLVPAAPGPLAAYPVSTLVNDVRNNGPQLVEPVAVSS
ncbi:MAG: SOS response-associated peptidase [Actinomycetota bacterium]|nr:MAG: SOS response-associated peptidase [Actinomycetota bacterium]